jgi:DNA end-binding protein Ku
MRFADELVDPEEIPVASGKRPGSRELSMAKTLVDQMSVKWDPARYSDNYRSALLNLINKKVAVGGKALPKGEKSHPRATNVIDLADVLRQSLEDAAPTRKGAKKVAKTSRKSTRRKAA